MHPPFIGMASLSTFIAITECHRLSKIYKEKIFFTVLEAGKSKIAALVLGESPHPGRVRRERARRDRPYSRPPLR